MKIMVIVWWIACLVGCRVDLGTDQILVLEMAGVAALPSTSTRINDSENVSFYDPVSQNFTLQAVNLTDSEGGLTELLTTDEDQTYTIVNRYQIIFSTDISSLIGNNYSQLEVLFEEESTGSAVVAGKVEADLPFTLDQSAVILADGITIETGISLTYHVKANWRYTVAVEENDTVMSAPELELIVATDSL